MIRIEPLTSEYELFLRDESKRTGFADLICFPADTGEVSEAMRYCAKRSIPLTIQGSRTGLGAGAVPEGGLVMSLEKLRKLELVRETEHPVVCETGTSDGLRPPVIRAGAGVPLSEIDEMLRRETEGKYFLPPDPTERSASAGGAASCNSSGARTYGYGPMRSYITGLTVVLADGEILKIRRGDCVSENGFIRFGAGSRSYEIKLPEYRMPDVKCASGYYIKEETDLTDLFIGAEGTLGIITEVEFRTEKTPEYIWGLIAFFDEEGGLGYARSLRKRFPKLNPARGLISIEFFDGGSLELLRTKGVNIPEGAKEAVFTETVSETREGAVGLIRQLEEEIIKAGGNPDLAWAAISHRSFREFKEVRHKTPEAVNEKVAEMKRKEASITKLGSDMSVPEEVFGETVKMYRHDLSAAGLDYVIFGHIGNCHLHCNIISRSAEEYAKGKEIYLRWADYVGRDGGSISAEHGVGKLKRDFLVKMYGEKAVEEMREVRRALDPEGLLGRGNIFE